MANRAQDWIRQADRDLDHARHATRDSDYEWACLAAQQAAEKALKGLYCRLGGEGWGHSLLKLLKELPREVPEGLLARAAALDKVYIPARYPNGFDSGAPFEYFDASDAERAIQDAEHILSYVRGQMG